MAKTRKRSSNKNDLNLNLNKNSRLITSYFNKANRSSDSEINESAVETETNTDKSPDFYEKCLNKKLDTCDPDKQCHAVKKQMQMQLDFIIQKEEQIERAISSCLKMCEKKDREIQILQNQIDQRKKIDVEPSTLQSKSHKVLFDEFKGNLTEIQLSTLRSLDKSMKGDSTFVINSVRFFYSDLTKLKHKSVTGRGKTQKEPISPQKMIRMKSLYHERLANLQLSDIERVKRQKKFNRHVH